MKPIEWYVYKPQGWEKSVGYRVDLKRCRASVHADFGVGFYQCLRKPKVYIEELGFCTQHSKIIKATMAKGETP